MGPVEDWFSRVAKPLHIALFISELAKRSSENNIGVSSIESAVYAIKWGHAMAGFEACKTIY